MDIEIRDTRNGDWFWVYRALLEDAHLESLDKLIYATLASFEGKRGIFPSMEGLAERAGTSERTAQVAIKKLIS